MSEMARWQGERAHRRIERREEHVGGENARADEVVEQGRLARVGVAHEAHDRIGNPTARTPVQAARTLDVLDLDLQPFDLVGDDPLVRFQLGLAGSRQEAAAAPLAFEMRPRPHEPTALIGQAGEFDLQATLCRPSASPEDLEDKTGAVDDLAGPGLLEVALLDRAQRAIDDRQPDMLLCDQPFQPFDRPLPDKGRWSPGR
jgi:hypothetical protein